MNFIPTTAFRWSVSLNSFSNVFEKLEFEMLLLENNNCVVEPSNYFSKGFIKKKNYFSKGSLFFILLVLLQEVEFSSLLALRVELFQMGAGSAVGSRQCDCSTTTTTTTTASGGSTMNKKIKVLCCYGGWPTCEARENYYRSMGVSPILFILELTLILTKI